MSKIIVGPGILPMRAGTAGVTRISDIIVPEIFAGYVQTLTTEKSRLVQSRALVIDERLNSDLVGGGRTFNQPFFNDLDSSDATGKENVSSDDPAVTSSPDKINAGAEVQVRLSRNKSWSSMDLSAALAGTDPMAAIANRVADWRVRRLQHNWIAMMKGVFAMNDAAPVGGSTHTAKDMSVDVSAETDPAAAAFNPSAFIRACGTMGDSMEGLSMVMMHSIVYQRLQLLNLIDFIPDARGEVVIKSYMGREVIVDDSMPFANGIADTYIIGEAATALGVGSPLVPVETERKPGAGNGGGQEILHNRWEWILHPVGHAYVGTGAPSGGPDIGTTAGGLAAATSWSRVFAERKQIRIARLRTKEA